VELVYLDRMMLMLVVVAVSMLALAPTLSDAISGNWTERTNTSTQDWTGIAMSGDGIKLVAVTYGQYAWTSTDSGTTWTEHNNQAFWSSVASSGDGTKIIGGIYGDNDFLISNDSGLNWSDQNGAMSYDWYDVDISTDGTRMVAFANADNVFISNDSGMTWQNTGQASGTQGAMSGNGLIVGTSVYGGDIFISNDSGTTWHDHTELGSQSWVGIGISGNGSRIAVADNQGDVFVSDDSAATWTNHSLGSFVNGLAMSKDGSTIGVWQATGDVFISDDNGMTWEDQTVIGSRDWSAMAFSDNGSRIAVAQFNDTGGRIWTFEENPLEPTTTTTTVAPYGACCQDIMPYLAKSCSDNATLLYSGTFQNQSYTLYTNCPFGCDMQQQKCSDPPYVNNLWVLVGVLVFIASVLVLFRLFRVM
jgi:hypothetical protein